MGLLWADTERRHNMRVYTCVRKGLRPWGALSACACACVTCIYVLATHFVGALPQKKNVWNKWKYNFYEMKGDVGMSLHENGRNKKMPTPRHKVTHNPIPTSLFLPRPQHISQAIGCQHVVLLALPNAFITNKQTTC